MCAEAGPELEPLPGDTRDRIREKMPHAWDRVSSLVDSSVLNDRATLGIARGLQVFTGSSWPGSGGQALYASRASMTPSTCPRLRCRPANVPFTW